MKKILTILSIFAASFSFGQVKSVVNGDTVIHQKSAILINPIALNINGDTAYSLFWIVDNISRDSTANSNGRLFLFDKKGGAIQTITFDIPSKIINEWIGNNSIDNFILNKYPKFKKL